MSREPSQYWGVPENAPQHPYTKYENSAVWRSLKKALTDLDQNQDIELTEWHQYILGYICKTMEEDGHNLEEK